MINILHLYIKSEADTLLLNKNSFFLSFFVFAFTIMIRSENNNFNNRKHCNVLVITIHEVIMIWHSVQLSLKWFWQFFCGQQVRYVGQVRHVRQLRQVRQVLCITQVRHLRHVRQVRHLRHVSQVTMLENLDTYNMFDKHLRQVRHQTHGLHITHIIHVIPTGFTC